MINPTSSVFDEQNYEYCVRIYSFTEFSTVDGGVPWNLFGEVSEWPKEHAWKVCVPQGTEGSNPSLTAKFP